MFNPFTIKDNSDKKDKELVKAIIQGDKTSLEELIGRHQYWIYNIAARMVFDPFDAEDITQEVLIKIITKISTYDENRGEFRTWLYRIVANHVINHKNKKHKEFTFKAYGKDIEGIPMEFIKDERTLSPELKIIEEEIKIECTTGMLLCLNPVDRMAFILGDIFGINSNIGSEILDISNENFRQKLSRSRKKLYYFMNKHCSLVNKDAKCNCLGGIRYLMENGFIDSNNLKYTRNGVKKVRDLIANRIDELDNLYSNISKVFRESLFYESPDMVASFKKILDSERVKKIFSIN